MRPMIRRMSAISRGTNSPDAPRSSRGQRVSKLLETARRRRGPRRTLADLGDPVLIVVIRIDDLRLDRLEALDRGRRLHARRAARSSGRTRRRCSSAPRTSGTHSRDAGKVDPPAAERDDVAVGFALRMIRLAGLDVVGGGRFDVNAGGIALSRRWPARCRRARASCRWRRSRSARRASAAAAIAFTSR